MRLIWLHENGLLIICQFFTNTSRIHEEVKSLVCACFSMILEILLIVHWGFSHLAKHSSCQLPASHSGTTKAMLVYTACQLLGLANASRLNASVWETTIELGIAARLPTRQQKTNNSNSDRTSATHYPATLSPCKNISALTQLEIHDHFTAK